MFYTGQLTTDSGENENENENVDFPKYLQSTSLRMAVLYHGREVSFFGFQAVIIRPAMSLLTPNLDVCTAYVGDFVHEVLLSG